ncbi:hypothetical protein UFOVP75_112 [uncultured Caudovirales phage]|uniref:Uncharacterized protein n=1 Tax=uncultured Caudovirales phage TaxID=2100421 RepID=A0A6J5L5U9_9CAUD|nr:hypothetical protein UFOVP75_112 [uncultured Caudovirales phage]
MRTIGLDLSTKTGFAVVDDGALTHKQTITLDKDILAYGSYPFCLLSAMDELIAKIEKSVLEYHGPNTLVVIEQINLGKNRNSQKTLEFIHCSVLSMLRKNNILNVVYLDSSQWRKNLGLTMSKDQKKDNAKLAKAKKEAALVGKVVDKAALGVKGKITKKHLAVDYVNTRFGLALKQKDNDQADAICLCCAAINHAPICDGK